MNKFSFVQLTIFTTCLFITIYHSSGQITKPCENHEEFKQLDFWIGEWKVTNPDGSEAGQNKITKVLDGCSLLEEWNGSGNSVGKSLNFYNRNKKQWQQVWIDNSANPLYFDGVAKQDSMIYTGISNDAKGNVIYNKMILSKQSDTKVRQLWSQSSDQKLNWTVVFDGLYTKVSSN